ncbi:MAG: hypothetical protein A2Y86_09300 [Candidatus Aminicenantes bacterium RBG_13_62_12]|nr:MAG: hypothetical protein A2Y86_09300 [Candidatus Aminicenantes bacterium RBG_13_62_12]
MTARPAPRRFRSRVYGPVPSRRLGFSLGIDILPFKICAYNCVYCQLGPSRKTRTRRGAFAPVGQVVSQVREALKKAGRIDSITFSGSGEPTLHSGLGLMIREIKKFTDIPVTVLTNGSLLSNRAVRRGLKAADRVVPSLDAAAEDVFRAVNRPHPSLRLSRVLRGLSDFRREYKGQIWLEVMLVKGVNDSPAHIAALKKAVVHVRPDKVQLNTVVRPPAEKWAKPLSARELERICRKLGPGCEVVASFRGRAPKRAGPAELERVQAMIGRRPVTAADIERSLGLHRKILEIILLRLLGSGKIKSVRHRGKDFFEPASPLSRPRRHLKKEGKAPP